MNIVLGQFAFLICVFSISKKSFKVEARPKEVIAVPGWFNSVEGFYFPSSNIYGPKTPKQHTAPTQLDSGDSVVVDNKVKRRKSNKRAKTLKKITRRFDDDETKGDKHKGHKKKRRKTKLKKLKFLKKTVKDGDYSNLSVSKETRDEKRKPVDITVHIKMND